MAAGGSGVDPAELPERPGPERSGAAAAVAFAKAQVGKGYRYATSGPDTFDCSGLTAAAWQRGGVGLAHYSGAQYQQTIRIGAGDLQPGDLVFYGPGGSQHVEIYIGGGMVVSASNPSSGVKLAGRALRLGLRLRPGPRLTVIDRGGRSRTSGSPASRTARAAPASSPPTTCARSSASCAASTPPDDPNLLVGLDTADDAAVYRVRDDLALVAHHRLLHADRRRPVRLGSHRRHQRAVRRVRDGRRAAARAEPRRVAARGLPFELLARVIDGGADVVRAAGALVAGGHSIDDPEPKFGLAVVGTVEPDRVLTQRRRPTGRRARAHQADRARRDLHRGEARARHRPSCSRPRSTSMTTLNARRARRGARSATPSTPPPTSPASGCSDTSASSHAAPASARVSTRAAVPVIDGVPRARARRVRRGRDAAQPRVRVGVRRLGRPPPNEQLLLADAQTSGGLLFAVDPDAADALVAGLEAAGTLAAARIGQLTADPPGTITVA